MCESITLIVSLVHWSCIWFYIIMYMVLYHYVYGSISLERHNTSRAQVCTDRLWFFPHAKDSGMLFVNILRRYEADIFYMLASPAASSVYHLFHIMSIVATICLCPVQCRQI